MYFKSTLCSIFSIIALVGSIQATKQTKQATKSLIGKKAPQFIAKALFPDGTVKNLDLNELIKEGHKIALYFYPWDSTPGCTKQAENFSANYPMLEAAGITVVGISCNSIAAHKRFQKKYKIPYILVSDSRLHRSIGKKYPGVISVGFYKRKTFLINSKGIVIKTFDQVNIETQVEEILNAFAQDTIK